MIDSGSIPSLTKKIFNLINFIITMRNEIYAIRQWKDWIRYGATSYNAKPWYSSEVKRINWQWILSATGQAVPAAYTKMQQKALEYFVWWFIITIVFLWIFY